jgi:salicylate hydroxylase
MTLPEQPEIAIIGSGLAGLTLSIGLARHGIPHRIYETASAFSEIGAGIALGPNSITALELIDPKIGEALQKCITYNEGVDEKGEGKTRQEWMDIRVGVEDGSVLFFRATPEFMVNHIER